MQGGLALHIRVQHDAIGRDHNPAIRVLLAQQRQFLPDVWRKEGLAQVQVEQLLEPEIARQIGHPREASHIHLSDGTDARRRLTVAAQAVDVAPNGVLKKHSPIWEPRLRPGKLLGSRPIEGGAVGGGEQKSALILEAGVPWTSPLCGGQDHGLHVLLRYPSQISTTRASGDGKSASGQLLAEFPRHGSEVDLLKGLFVQVPQVPGAVVVLTIAGEGQVAVNRQVVFRFT